MIKSIIVDDEPRAIRALELLVEKHCPEVEVLAVASNINEAYKLIVDLDPEIIFLDINMPNGTGFDLLYKLKGYGEAKVIFTTAYEEYALKALRLSAIDYLLKPIDKDDLVNAIDRFKVEEKKSRESAYRFFEKMMELRSSDRVAISTINGVHVLDTENIFYLSSDKNYTTFHLGDSTILSSKSLGDYEKILENKDFLRIHRSFIINLQQVVEYDRRKNGVILGNNCFVEVSKNKKEQLLQKLNVV